MLAKPVGALPANGDFLYEPKWDGFRAIVFRGAGEIYIQSRDLKPLDRYFPDLHDSLLRLLPAGCIVDGEIVIATPRGLDFDALQLRLHPAESRVAKLARETPASFVAFDILAADGRDLMGEPLVRRRTDLEKLLAPSAPPLHLTPITRDHGVAVSWLAQFEGAGLDGVVAKPVDLPYQPGKRVMLKVKHVRTADCVVAGFRWYKQGEQSQIGSLLLGLFDDAGALQHVGVCASFTAEKRRELVEHLAPYRKDALVNHPWRLWAEAQGAGPEQRMPGGQSRWSQGKDLSWEPLRPELVVEVTYEHMQGARFRHMSHFRRWRTDKRPEDCTYAQLEVVPPQELQAIFGAGR